MKDELQPRAENYTEEHIKKRRWHKVVTALAAVVVFCTTYALILPAITWERSLICELPEHHHVESCYETVTVPAASRLVCNTEEHTHGDDCFNETGELVCLSEEHVHTDACHETVEEHTETVLTCGLEEHEHTAACFDAPPAEEKEYFCGKIEHIHSEAQHCYFSDGTLRCTIPEHQHTLACKSNPSANLEDAARWEATFKDVELIGNWNSDILDIAESQLGYTESTKNYKVQQDGKTINGYTRYGDWYGSPYGDWCAMFCSFCIDYAGVQDYPLEANCNAWIKALSYDENDPDKPVYYHEVGTYEPKPGDMVFFDWDKYNPKSSGQRDAEHIGFVVEITEAIEATEETEGIPAQLITIEGNSADKVQNVTYDMDDERILGYGEIPENENYKTEISGTDLFYTKIKSEPAEDGAVTVIEGALPENAEVSMEAVTLSADILTEYFGEEKAAAMQSYAAYDIKIMADGKEWQPDESVSVKVKKPSIDITKNDILSAAHIDSKTDAASSVETAVLNDTGDIVFDADGFSTYIFFTVDFEYEDVTWSIEGESSVLLSTLFEKLGITRPAEEATKVRFSNPTLVEVTKLDGDWLLTSLLPFDTEETLKITFADGTAFVINVTDAQINSNTGYWKKVTSIDDTNSYYMIVRNTGTAANNNYAFTRNGTGFSRTQVTINGVTGQTGYYTVNTNVTDAMQYRFGTAVGGGGTTTVFTMNGTTPNYLTMSADNTAFGTSSTNLSVKYNDTATNSNLANAWAISNSSDYYLAYGDNAFHRRYDANYYFTWRTMDIYKYYPGTTKNSGVFTVNVYTLPVDSAGNAIGNAVLQNTLTVNNNSTTTNINEDLFKSYNIEGSYVGAYFGTEYSKTVTNVKTLGRTGSNNSERRLVITGDTTNNSYNGGNDAIFLTYTKTTPSADKWVRCTATTDFTTDGEYMIVRDQDGVSAAFGITDAGAATTGNITITSAGTQDGVETYKISGNGATEKYVWEFSDLNGYKLRNTGDDTKYLRLNNTAVIGSSTNASSNTFTRATENNTTYWTIQNGSYYLRYGTSGFERANSNNGAYLSVFRKVTASTPETLPDETVRSSNGNSYTMNVYTVQVNDAGVETGEPELLNTITIDYNNSTVNPQTLFTNSGIDGTYVKAVYKTADGTVRSNGVTSITRAGNNGARTLNVTGTPSYTVNGNNKAALYLQYKKNYETVKDGNNYAVNVYAVQINSLGQQVGDPVKVGVKTFSDNTEVVPSDLFNAYGLSGIFKNAYYGTADEATYSDVNFLQRTGTEGNYALHVDYDVGRTLDVTGNNENALFLRYRSGEPIIPEDTREIVHSKYIDAFRDGTDNPDTTLDNLADDDELKDLYRLYLDIGPEAAYENMDILFVIDRSSSMCQVYDGSSRGGGDAVDILGYGNSDSVTDPAKKQMVWRRAALDSMLNGLEEGTFTSTSGTNARFHDNMDVNETNLKQKAVLVENGLLSKIWSVNQNNRVAIVEFASLAQVSRNWNDPIGPFATDNTEGGTNYMAGLIEARNLLEASADDDRRKVMFFISDGTPSRYMTQNAQGTWVSNGSTLAPSNCVPNNPLYDNTVDYITEFMKDFSTKNGNTPRITEVEIHCISVGSGKSDADATNVPFLAMMDEDGDPSTTETMRSSVLSSLDFKEIQVKIDSLVTNRVGLCSDIVLDDTLSEYVEFADQDDFKVEMVSTRDGTSQTLYENGAFVKTAGFNAQDYLKSVSYNKTTKTVHVELKNQLVGEVIFRTSFNVKTTDEAYVTYAANAEQTGNTGYNGVEGDTGTDYKGNKTSSEKPGFHSNSDAVVVYSQRFGENVSHVEIPFDHPVVQVYPIDITVDKEWADGKEHESDIVKFELRDKSVPNGNVAYTVVESEIILSAANNWQYTFENLPGSHTYEVVETVGKNDFVPSYEWSSDGTECTIINSPATVSITLQKTNQFGDPITSPASFAIYSDSNLTQKVGGTITTDGDGKAEIADLVIGSTYWLVETNPPIGFVQMPNARSFTVTADGANVSVYDTYLSASDGVLYVKNTAGAMLPATGGHGTAPFYIAGGLLLGGALLYGCAQKRRRKERAE